MARHRYCDGILAGTHKKGRIAEEIAAAEMIRRKFKDVQLNPNLKGPDITAKAPIGRWTFEVKSAVRYIRHGKYEFWLTEKVSRLRQNDDFVVVVMPDKTVHIYTMEYHKLLSRKDGRRNVTSLLKGSTHG